MSKLRKKALQAVKLQMRLDGEIESQDSDDLHRPRNARQRVLQQAREAFEEAGISRQHIWTESFEDRIVRAKSQWRRKIEARQLKRQVKSQAQAQLLARQKSEGADERGVKYVDIEVGMPCEIVPTKLGDQIVKAGFGGWPDGTVVTALWDDTTRGWHGNRDIECVMPSGEMLTIPKTRLSPIFPDDFTDEEEGEGDVQNDAG
jgi:hypothetical protein